MKILLHFVNPLFLTFYKLYNEDYLYRASALAYASLLSLIPFLSVLFYLMLFLPQSEIFLELIHYYLITNLLPSNITYIDTYFKIFIAHASELPSFSFIFLFLTAFMLLKTITSTLQLIWKDERKLPVRSYFLYIMIMLIIFVLFIFSLFIHFYLTSINWTMTFNQQPLLNFCFHFVFSFILNGFFFSLIFLVIPKNSNQMYYDLLGGFVTALIFEIVRLGFGFFINLISNYDLIYGVFAIIPLFVFWLYIFWVIILIGALFTFELHRYGSLS